MVMLSIASELAWDKPCEEVIPNRITIIGLIKIHPISIFLGKKKWCLNLTASAAMPQPCFCMRTTRHCALSLSLEQWHLSGLCGDADEPFGFRKRHEGVWGPCHIFRRNRCVIPPSACGTLRLEGPVPPGGSCWVLPQRLPWAGISPLSQAVPVLLCPSHPKALFPQPESFLLQVGPVPTHTAMEIAWFPLLAAAFYALHAHPLA